MKSSVASRSPTEMGLVLTLEPRDLGWDENVRISFARSIDSHKAE